MFPNDYLCALFLYLITVLSSQIKITNIQPESLYKGLTTFTGAMKGWPLYTHPGPSWFTGSSPA